MVIIGSVTIDNFVFRGSHRRRRNSVNIKPPEEAKQFLSSAGGWGQGQEQGWRQV